MILPKEKTKWIPFCTSLSIVFEVLFKIEEEEKWLGKE